MQDQNEVAKNLPKDDLPTLYNYNDPKIKAVYVFSIDDIKENKAVVDWQSRIPERIKDVKDSFKATKDNQIKQETDKIAKNLEGQTPIKKRLGSLFHELPKETNSKPEKLSKNDQTILCEYCEIHREILNDNVTFDGNHAYLDAEQGEIETGKKLNLPLLEQFVGEKLTNLEAADAFCLIITHVTRLTHPVKTLFGALSVIKLPQDKEDRRVEKLQFGFGMKSDAQIFWKTTKDKRKICEVVVNLKSIAVNGIQFRLNSDEPDAEFVKIDDKETKTEDNKTRKFPLIMQFKIIYEMGKTDKSYSLNILQLEAVAFTSFVTFPKIIIRPQPVESLRSFKNFITKVSEGMQTTENQPEVENDLEIVEKTCRVNINQKSKEKWTLDCVAKKFIDNTAPTTNDFNRSRISQPTTFNNVPAQFNEQVIKLWLKKAQQRLDFIEGKLDTINENFLMSYLRELDSEKVFFKIKEIFFTGKQMVVKRHNTIYVEETMKNLSQFLTQHVNYNEKKSELPVKINFICANGGRQMLRFLVAELNESIKNEDWEPPKNIQKNITDEITNSDGEKIQENKKIEFSDDPEYCSWEIVWENRLGKIICDIKAHFGVMKIDGKEHIINSEGRLEKKSANEFMELLPIIFCRTQFELVVREFNQISATVNFLLESCYTVGLQSARQEIKRKKVTKGRSNIQGNPIEWSNSGRSYFVPLPKTSKSKEANFLLPNNLHEDSLLLKNKPNPKQSFSCWGHCSPFSYKKNVNKDENKDENKDIDYKSFYNYYERKWFGPK